MEQPWAALYVPAELDGPTLEDLCEMLVRQNERYLRKHPEVPLLYRSGAYYRLQPEYWLAIPWAILSLRMGLGLDCKTLAAWRAAELRARAGERATCVWSSHPTPEKLVYHVRVRRANGSIEDPSAYLGMNAALPGGSYQEEPAWTPSPYRY